MLLTLLIKNLAADKLHTSLSHLQLPPHLGVLQEDEDPPAPPRGHQEQYSVRKKKEVLDKMSYIKCQHTSEAGDAWDSCEDMSVINKYICTHNKFTHRHPEPKKDSFVFVFQVHNTAEHFLRSFQDGVVSPRHFWSVQKIYPCISVFLLPFILSTITFPNKLPPQVSPSLVFCFLRSSVSNNVYT